MILLLLVANLLGSQQERIKNPDIEVIHEKLEDLHTTITTDEDYYHYFEQKFLINLIEVRNEYVFDITHNRSECNLRPQKLRINEIVGLELYKNTDNVYYTDIHCIHDHQLCFLVTDNYVLQQVKLEQDGTGSIKHVQKIKENLNIEKNQPSSNIKFALNSKSKYDIIVSNKMAYFFTKSRRINDGGFEIIKASQFKQREHMYETAVFLDMLFVAVGKDGIDIYQIKDKDLVFFKNLHIDEKNQDLIDIKVNQDTSHVIVLDRNSGLHFYNDNLENVLSVHFPRAISFSFIHHTYMLVAETVNRIEYACEIFVDLVKNEYFFNRVYIEDIEFKGVQMFSKFALFIGVDDHFFVEHSIFNSIIKRNQELVGSFEEDELVKFEKYVDLPPNHANKHIFDKYYIGLAKGDFKVYQVEEEDPTLVCQFTKEGMHYQEIILKSRLCKKLKTSNPYKYCEIKQNLQLEVKEAFIESDSKMMVIIISVTCGFLFLLALICIFFVGKRWKLRLEALKKERDEFKKYSALQDQLGESAVIKGNV